MGRQITPIFIFSLPRSGSTLLQRMLARHPAIDTLSETWLLLPLVYNLKAEGLYAEYKHNFYRQAQDNFLSLLPNGEESYRAAIRHFATSLYTDLCAPESDFFVDKTPPYSLITDEIIKIFPDARFIFLWRNPLSVIASIMNTWAGGRFNLFRTKKELYEGMETMIRAYTDNSKRVCAVRYEDLCSNPEAEMSRLLNYIGVKETPARLKELYEVKIRGTMGDDSMMRNSPIISREMTEKWKMSLGNPVRRRWCRRYLKWLGAERLALMGYEQNVLLEELDRLPFTLEFALSDTLRIAYGNLNAVFEFELLRRKLTSLKAGRRIYSHS